MKAAGRSKSHTKHSRQRHSRCRSGSSRRSSRSSGRSMEVTGHRVTKVVPSQRHCRMLRKLRLEPLMLASNNSSSSRMAGRPGTEL